MQTDDKGLITRCSEYELFQNWLYSGLYYTHTFEEYKRACIKAGTEITETEDIKPEVTE